MRQRDRQAAMVVAIALFASLFLLAGAPRWATCISVGLCLAALVPYLGSRRELVERKPLTWFFVAAIAATAIQLIPFPLVVVEVLSPHKAELVKANAGALGQPAPMLSSLSVDAPLTLVELAKLVGYFVFAIAVMRIGAHRHGRRFLFGGVVIAAFAVAVSALVHGLLGAELLFGIYSPREMDAPRFLSPVLNRNHLAGLAALTTPLSIGLAFRASGPPRIFWFLCAATIATAALLGGSRAGAVAIAFGCIVSLALNLLLPGPNSKLDRKTRVSTAVRVAVIAVCMGVLLTITAGSGLVREFKTASADELASADGRVELWRGTLDLSSSYWLTGVGRGAFEQAFTPFNRSAARVTFARAENEYLQAVADWGLPMSALLGAFFLLVVGRGLRSWKQGHAQAGAVAGLVALAAHNMVDFSLEMPGIALCAVTCVALLMPAQPRSKVTPRGRYLRWAGFSVAVLVLILAMTPLAKTPREDAADLAGPANTKRAQEAWQRHPADFVSASHVARALASERDPRASAALNRALSFHPDHPTVHRIAGLLLLRSQRPVQALDEYRIAIRHSRDTVPVIDELVRYFPDPEQAVEALPIEDDKQVVGLSRALGKRGLTALNLLFLERAATVLPSAVETHERLVGIAARLGRRDLARTTGWKIMRIRPSAGVGTSLAAAELAAGNFQEAAKAVEIVRNSVPLGPTEELDLMILQARGYHGAKDHERARAVLQSALTLGPPKAKAASIYRLLAEVEDSLMNDNGANWARDQLRSVVKQPRR